MSDKTYHIAVIDEATCIGCTKCLAVCPVDAIVGATQQLHTVLSDYCIGCNLCLPPCPVQCIRLETLEMSAEDRLNQAKAAKKQHQVRKTRLEQQEAQKRAADLQASNQAKDILAATLARAKAKKQEFSW
ncbi:RnfABCDGE type electron transport complex subunit B [Candidatus Berkiella aquae]|uniref:Electron transport complex protein rnfB n=1 Tax=Candidatus Berkiella aquae TaxID=295108 RepID=A0A0Q9YXL4_9GAMM|nr:RnfABCDGE type electron transport complex subunit B [Candidatus Berkiella aquae]MCS5710961.1 RnfABCDGE type electron transport complex subunit B [Candidatus Berkiella aquae]